MVMNWVFKVFQKKNTVVRCRGITKIRLCVLFQGSHRHAQKLEPLRCGDFRVVSAERGSGLIIYAREYCNQRVTICINRGGKAADLDEEYGKLHWSEGLDHRKLYDHGFAVFVDGQC